MTLWNGKSVSLLKFCVALGVHFLLCKPSAAQSSATHQNQAEAGPQKSAPAESEPDLNAESEPELETELIIVKEKAPSGAESMLQKRKESVGVADGISADDIRKSAASSASDVASRVVGATIVGDRFIYVRGLGERYVGVLLSGLPVPSPEPEQHAVPFDVFPASMLGGLRLLKTASPDLPADMTGGTVELSLLEFPTRRKGHVSLGISANAQTAFLPMLTHPGGRTDFLGMDDGGRGIPPGERGNALYRTFRNAWSPYRQETGPVGASFSGSFGDTATLFGKRLGYLFAVKYSADFQTRAEDVKVLNLLDTAQGPKLSPLVQFWNEPGAFERGEGRYSVRSTFDVNWRAMGTASLQIAPLTRMSLTALFSQTAEQETRIYQGYSQDQFSEVWNSRVRYVSRSLATVILSGSHYTPHENRPRLWDFALSYSLAARQEPDNREVTYLRKDDGLFHFTPKGQSGQRFFSDNLEHQGAGRLDVTQRVRFGKEWDVGFQAGAFARYRQRGFSARRFKFGFGGVGDIDDTRPPEELFSAENLGRAVEVRENTNTSDRYDARMGVYGAYVRAEIPFGKRIQLVSGLRLEAANQRLFSFDPQQGDKPLTVALDTVDPLPSANVVFHLPHDMHIRAAASMTIARPEFRELAPFQFTNFFGGEVMQGNPALNRTRIANVDLRWEWFLGEADVLAVSVFGKYFDAPIETTLQAGGDLIRSLANARAAYNIGAELEFRKDLGVWEQGLKGVSLGGNVTWLHSRVDLEGVAGQQTSKIRPLQGQSPFVINLFAELALPGWGTELRILYHVFGERIDQVGAFGLPDKWEQPRHGLDVTISQKLYGKLSLNFSARNLINSPVQIMQRGETKTENGRMVPLQETTLKYTTGQTMNLSLSYEL